MNPIKTHFFHTLLLISSALLSACSAGEVRDQLGLTRQSPDEFAVLRRAPLEIPEELLVTASNDGAALPTPEKGAPRPQETSPDEKARQALLGTNTQPAEITLSSADQSFLTKTGALEASPSIRSTVNLETATLHDRNKPVAEKLLGIGGDKYEPSATVVDAEKEAQRLRTNKEEGKPVTAGETPSIEE